MKIRITEDMRNKCWEFANAIIKTDNQYNRLLPKDIDNKELTTLIRIQRTYVGKLAECAVLEYLKTNGIEYSDAGMFDIYDGQKNVDAYDLITKEGKSIDIKVAYKSNHRNLVINKEQFETAPKDYYLAVQIKCEDMVGQKYLIDTENITEAYIKGFADKVFLSKLKYKHLGESECKVYPIDKLMNPNRILMLM